MKKQKTNSTEADSVFFLKLVLYFVVGSQWLFFTNAEDNYQLPIPVGLVLGIGFAMHEHFQIDRRIEYAILLMSSAIGFWGQHIL